MRYRNGQSPPNIFPKSAPMLLTVNHMCVSVCVSLYTTVVHGIRSKGHK